MSPSNKAFYQTNKAYCVMHLFVYHSDRCDPRRRAVASMHRSFIGGTTTVSLYARRRHFAAKQVAVLEEVEGWHYTLGYRKIEPL